MKIHELKILPQYFNDVQDGSKNFEIRKNDRGFEVGDKIILKEYIQSTERTFEGEKPVVKYKGYTGREITKEISYIYEGGQYGLEEGYCILGLKTPFKEDVLNQLLEIGLDAKTIQGCYERYKWHIDYYKDAVILKNIDLAEIDLEEQKRKVVEEENEFMDAFFEYTISNKSEKFKNHVIEELWDEFQAKLGLLEKEGIAAKEVMKEYPKHLEKIKHRPR